MTEQDYDHTVRTLDERITTLEETVEQQDRDHGKALLYLTIALAASVMLTLALAFILEYRLDMLRSEIIGLLA